MTFKVSHSKLKTWRRCRQAYHLRYVERLRSNRKPRPLMFGTIIHEMIQAHIEGDDPMEKLDEIDLANHDLFRGEREMYGDLVSDIRCIMSEYFDYYKNDGLSYVRINRRRAEHEFEVEIAPGIIATGKIDAVARSKGLRWLVEHKSFNHMPGEDERWRSMQSSVYLRMGEMLGWPPMDGTLWDYVHSKAPTRPKILKDGTVSKKGIITLPSRVAEVLRDNKLDPKKYDSLMNSALKSRRHYFQRIYTPVKESVVGEMVQDFICVAKEVRAGHGTVKDRNIDRHCSYCDYEGICRAAITGGDVDFIKERDFHVTKKVNRHGEPQGS